jgi:hypothetical protein
MSNFQASESGVIKAGDIASFKGFWDAEVKTADKGIITVIGNDGVFMDDSFQKKEEFTIEDLKRIFRKFNVLRPENTHESIIKYSKLYESDRFPVSVHRMILNAIKPHRNDLKQLHDKFLALVENKIGKIY